MLDAGLRFTAAGGDTVTGSANAATTSLTNVIDMWETSSTNPNTDAWDSAKLPELGGMTLNVEVDTAITSTTAGAGIITFHLTSHTAAGVSAGTSIASLPLNGSTTLAVDEAIGVRKSLTLPDGFTVPSRYLGVTRVISGQTISAGAVHVFLTKGADVPG